MSIQQASVCRILVAHDEPIAAAGLLAALGSEHSFEATAATAHDGDYQYPFDVVIADHRTAMELLAQARLHVLPGHLLSARVIVLSARLQPVDIRQAIRGGATGYLHLSCSLKELTLGVRTVALGRRYLCSAVSRQMADGLLNVALTSREDDVMRQLVRGHCNKVIAKTLGIAPGTVKTHMQSIMAKLNARTRNEAASIARSRGLVDEPAPTPTCASVDAWRPVFRRGTGQRLDLRSRSADASARPC